MSTEKSPIPNFRIYDRMGFPVIQDIYAETLGEAIEEGREWIEDGDWAADSCDKDGNVIARCRTIALECEVGAIVYRPVSPDEHSDDETVCAYSWAWSQSQHQWITHLTADDLAADSGRICRALGGHQATVSVDGAPADDGLTRVGVYCRTDVGWPLEIDSEATDAAKMHDCSGSYSDEEPDCPAAAGWDFVGTATAGLDDFGCRSHGGTRMTHYEVCRNTGIYRDTVCSGSQRNHDEPLKVVTYRVRDEASEAYVVERHTDDDGFLLEWLATYLARSLSARMNEEQAKEWVLERTDDDEIDQDKAEHAFAAIFGRRANDQERMEGLWSHLNASISRA